MRCIMAGLVAAATAAAAEPRAARSVHLGYQAPDAAAFTIGMTVVESTAGSYFMAAGWDTGYFGVQELGGGRKVVIFSVWDPTRGDDPAAVKAEDRVECLHAADGMRIKRFGGEGTGGQCMGDLDWKLDEPLRFAVVARPDGEKTAYEGHLRAPASGEWRHLVTFRTRTGGRPLRGLYSFVEDFRRDGGSVHDVRRARFHDAWVRDVAGAWKPLLAARFTASGADWEAKDSIDAGVEGRVFTLATGGDVRASRRLGSMVEVPAGDEAAPDVPF
ncbi:MAG: DUF3472 domain-containing protein [Planctomycetaceae bacterium]